MNVIFPQLELTVADTACPLQLPTSQSVRLEAAGWNSSSFSFTAGFLFSQLRDVKKS
jgi:hypothetical protein